MTNLSLQFDCPPFSDAQYEMVLLHPEHFLPCGTSITFFSKSEPHDHLSRLSSKNYVVGYDRTLREAPGTAGCSRLPSFSFDAVRTTYPLNPFLAILNAAIHFRRYRRMGLPHLTPDVENLIDLTIELVELIYWVPDAEQPEPHGLATQSVASIQRDSRVLTEHEEGNTSSFRKSRTGGSAIPYPGKNATLNERKAYGLYLVVVRLISIYPVYELLFN